MRGQPVRERLRVAALQQVKRRPGLAVDDDRAVVLPAPDGEVVHPEDPRGGRRRVRGGHDQPEQHLPARRHAQAPGEPGAGPASQRDRDVLQRAAQRRGLPPVGDGQARDLLGERPALAAGDRAEEPADGQPDHHPAPADGGVGQPPAVTAVHPGRHRPARRARRRARPRPGQHEQQPARRHDFVDHRPGQVRQEKAQLNGGTRA
jgi:hypothetical protein